MMAATLADGETVIENAAREPEVVDLQISHRHGREDPGPARQDRCAGREAAPRNDL